VCTAVLPAPAKRHPAQLPPPHRARDDPRGVELQDRVYQRLAAPQQPAFRTQHQTFTTSSGQTDTPFQTKSSVKSVIHQNPGATNSDAQRRAQHCVASAQRRGLTLAAPARCNRIWRLVRCLCNRKGGPQAVGSAWRRITTQQHDTG